MPTKNNTPPTVPQSEEEKAAEEALAPTSLVSGSDDPGVAGEVLVSNQPSAEELEATKPEHVRRMEAIGANTADLLNVAEGGQPSEKMTIDPAIATAFAGMFQALQKRNMVAVTPTPGLNTAMRPGGLSIKSDGTVVDANGNVLKDKDVPSEVKAQAEDVRNRPAFAVEG